MAQQCGGASGDGDEAVEESTGTSDAATAAAMTATDNRDLLLPILRQLLSFCSLLGKVGSFQVGSIKAFRTVMHTAAEASAGDKAAEAHVNALARISELEEVVGGHAAALEAERASVATLQRQLEAQGGEVACLTQQLQGSILQSIERSNAQLSSQRKRGAR